MHEDMMIWGGGGREMEEDRMTAGGARGGGGGGGWEWGVQKHDEGLCMHEVVTVEIIKRF